jgi:hypothetical protein
LASTEAEAPVVVLFQGKPHLAMLVRPREL